VFGIVAAFAAVNYLASTILLYNQTHAMD